MIDVGADKLRAEKPILSQGSDDVQKGNRVGPAGYGKQHPLRSRKELMQADELNYSCLNAIQHVLQVVCPRGCQSLR